MSEIAILGRGFESLLIALSVVVNAQADALAAKVYLLSRNLMRVKLAIRRSVSHLNEEKPEISTGHHNQITLGPW
ncbi:TPA: hypothetical protein ACGSTA_001178 [Enterobacter cloacae]|uniref:hypothetical protein n=1 Tax=Enterobacter cloacae complex sp. SHL021 TaxID=3412402 RepID=UPI00377212B7